MHLPKTKKCDIINIYIIFKIKYMTPRNVDNLAVGMPEELATTRNEGAKIREFKEEEKVQESKKDRKAREARERQEKIVARDLARKKQSYATKSGGRIAEVRQEIGLPKTEIGESNEESAEPTIPFSDLYPTPEQDKQLRKIVEAKKNAPAPKIGEIDTTPDSDWQAVEDSELHSSTLPNEKEWMRSVVGPNQLDRMLTPLDKLDDRLEEHKIDKLLEKREKGSSWFSKLVDRFKHKPEEKIIDSVLINDTPPQLPHPQETIITKKAETSHALKQLETLKQKTKTETTRNLSPIPKKIYTTQEYNYILDLARIYQAGLKQKDDGAIIEAQSRLLDEKLTPQHAIEMLTRHNDLKAQEDKNRSTFPQKEVRHVIQSTKTTKEGPTIIPPADMNLARLSAQAESSKPPQTLFGKFKSWLSGESAYNKYGQMAEGPVQKPIAPELEQMGTNEEQAKGEAMLSSAESLSTRDFKKTMKAGEKRAKAEQLEEKAIEEEVSGPKQEIGRKNMEKLSETLEQLEKKIEELQPIVESTQLGWFTKLKTIKKKGPDYGKITNLPEGNENITLIHLEKEKKKLEAKGKTNEANKIAEQIRVLPEYTNILVQREKILSETGQT